MFHIQYVLDSLKETRTRARNIRALLVSALYNAADTMDSYYTNLYQSHKTGLQEEGCLERCLTAESSRSEVWQTRRQT